MLVKRQNRQIMQHVHIQFIHKNEGSLKIVLFINTLVSLTIYCKTVSKTQLFQPFDVLSRTRFY